MHKVPTIKRVIPSKQWNTELHKSLNSTPWDPKGKDATDTGSASGRVRPPPGLEIPEESTEETKRGRQGITEVTRWNDRTLTLDSQRWVTQMIN